MKNRFNLIKTIQLAVFIVLTVITLLVVFLSEDVYSMIASDPSVRIIAVILWIVLGLSFVFLYYDFYSFAGLKKANAELDNAIFSDALTGIANRYSLDVYIGQYQNKPLPETMGCVTIEFSNLKEINEKLGHNGGNDAIQLFSEFLQRSAGRTGFVGRNGGNRFVVIFKECTAEQMQQFLGSFEALIREHNEGNEIGFEYHAGTAFKAEEEVQSLSELVALSDRRAWKNGHPGA